LEQQKKAFYDLNIESTLLQDFLEEMGPYKSKGQPEFPPPETIFRKKFAFLSAPLIVLQKSRRGTDPSNVNIGEKKSYTDKKSIGIYIQSH